MLKMLFIKRKKSKKGDIFWHNRIILSDVTGIDCGTAEELFSAFKAQEKKSKQWPVHFI